MQIEQREYEFARLIREGKLDQATATAWVKMQRTMNDLRMYGLSYMQDGDYGYSLDDLSFVSAPVTDETPITLANVYTPEKILGISSTKDIIEIATNPMYHMNSFPLSANGILGVCILDWQRDDSIQSGIIKNGDKVWLLDMQSGQLRWVADRLCEYKEKIEGINQFREALPGLFMSDLLSALNFLARQQSGQIEQIVFAGLTHGKVVEMLKREVPHTIVGLAEITDLKMSGLDPKLMAQAQEQLARAMHYSRSDYERNIAIGAGADFSRINPYFIALRATNLMDLVAAAH
jgi:hypothetical protein